MRRWLRGWVLVLGMALVSQAACDVGNMAFFKDERLRILEPTEQATVTLPMTVRWETQGFTVTGRDGQRSPDAGYFAIFVDRSPIPPDHSLEWFVQQNESCGAEPCGSLENLADVYTTQDPSLKLTHLPATSETTGKEVHQIVIVLLDGQGKRIGESAFRVRFTFEREA